ncbi:NCS1 family nucleobase:cation symporter-1 [uncultured Megasphaera sp.]|uniref:NCS1 family nucleobase:cation symporter-1 n=1 Tax=uncultured Megasphaera sp. TaxID=165188 RepID=UPI002659463E|nr:NCS1 family nucleobase:cation symporter-1 [uncultured Megasphaera sp.]
MATEVVSQDIRELGQDAINELKQGAYYNKDLAPTTVKERTWGTGHFISLWVGMAHNIPAYMLASGLIALGMNWKQTIFTIALANIIVLIPMLLNAHPGTKYGIPFPVLSRASFGVAGANIAALLRAGVACGWFGINAFIGGTAVNNFLIALFPAWKQFGGGFTILGLPLPEMITFLGFLAMNIIVAYKGMNSVKKFEVWAAPIVMILAFALLVWIVIEADGFGPIFAEEGRLNTWDTFLPVFIPSLTGMIGFWATLSLNIPDFTRFGKGQKQQMIGQAVGLPPTMTIFSIMAVIISSATVVVFGKAIWDPVDLLLHFSNPLVLAFSLFGIIVATLSVNIAANLISPAFDFANVAPKYISFKKGVLITGVFAIVMMPWKLMADPSMYIFNWLNVYSGLLGPIAAIIIADYFVHRHMMLDLISLYKADGIYQYTKGFNIAAVMALLIGAAFAIIGKIVPSLGWLFNYAWFVGFGVSFFVYLGLMKVIPQKNAKAAVVQDTTSSMR